VPGFEGAYNVKAACDRLDEVWAVVPTSHVNLRSECRAAASPAL
jgi:hypothetical protein